jgi:FIST C domain
MATSPAGKNYSSLSHEQAGTLSHWDNDCTAPVAGYVIRADWTGRHPSIVFIAAGCSLGSRWQLAGGSSFASERDHCGPGGHSRPWPPWRFRTRLSSLSARYAALPRSPRGLGVDHGGDVDSVLAATDAACRDFLAALEGRPPLGMLAFDCIARRGVLGDRGIRTEIQRLAAIAGGAAVSGFYAYGEIAHAPGMRGFHNQTLVFSPPFHSRGQGDRRAYRAMPEHGVPRDRPARWASRGCPQHGHGAPPQTQILSTRC